MTLGGLIEDLQALAEEHGNEVNIEINVEADPMSTINEEDAVAYELGKTEVWVKHGHTKVFREDFISLYFS